MVMPNITAALPHIPFPGPRRIATPPDPFSYYRIRKTRLKGASPVSPLKNSSQFRTTPVWYFSECRLCRRQYSSPLCYTVYKSSSPHGISKSSVNTSAFPVRGTIGFTGFFRAFHDTSLGVYHLLYGSILLPHGVLCNVYFG